MLVTERQLTSGSEHLEMIDELVRGGAQSDNFLSWRRLGFDRLHLLQSVSSLEGAFSDHLHVCGSMELCGNTLGM